MNHSLWLGWIPGLKIGITFLCRRFFLFIKLKLIQLIKLILEVTKFSSDSLGNRFWKFRSDFEIAWVASICVGVLFSKSLNVWIFLRWSFLYMESGLFIWFHVNPRNFNPRNFWFLVSFSFKTIFPQSPPVMSLISKDGEFYCASFDICQNFAPSCPRTETPTQKFKSEFSLVCSQGIGSSLVSF